MLIPFESGTHLRVPPGTDVVSMELSPDGKLYAVASPSFLQIWSACSELILLNQVSLQRSDSASAEQLRRVFVVWRSNSLQLAVVCGEGIVLEWDVEYEEYMFEQHHKNDTSIYLPSCKLTALPKRNVDEYGEPLCVSSTPNSILLGTAAGNLVEIEWSGISRGYPISAPIMIFLPEVSKVLPDVFGLSSIDYDPYLKLLAVVLDSRLTLLFRISYEKRIYFEGCFDLHISNASRLRMGTRSHILAIAKTDSDVSVFGFHWTNESVLPEKVCDFSLSRYDTLYFPPENWVPEVTHLSWNEENDHLAVSYGARGFAVWNFQESPIFWYTEKDASYCAQCSCFSPLGDVCLLNGVEKIVAQSFLRSNDVVSC